MDYRLLAPERLALRIAVRAVAIGVLAFVVARLVTTTQLYAVAVVIAGVAVVIATSVARQISEAHRSTGKLLETMGVDICNVPGCESLSHPAWAPAPGPLNTARIEYQQQLEYTRTLLDTVAAALIVLDADERVTLVNQAARRLAAAPAAHLQQIAAIGVSAARELQALAAGTRQIVRLADGQQMLAIATEFSIPQQQPRRLISLQRIAGELDAVELKAWQDVSRVLAHEMMNSLTPISSLSQSLEDLLKDAFRRSDAQPDGGASAEIAAALEAIKRRSDGLMSFVERYRRVAELPQLQAEPVHVETLLAGIERLMSATFREKGIAYRRESVAPALHVFVDVGLVEQALLNLLRNAAEAFTGVTAPLVEVSCELRERQVAIGVADNGRGFDESARAQLFVPFFTTKPGGSGIGLSFARQVALAHGGRLEVQANQPRGARFWLILPAVQPDSAAASD